MTMNSMSLSTQQDQRKRRLRQQQQVVVVRSRISQQQRRQLSLKSLLLLQQQQQQVQVVQQQQNYTNYFRSYIPLRLQLVLLLYLLVVVVITTTTTTILQFIIQQQQQQQQQTYQNPILIHGFSIKNNNNNNNHKIHYHRNSRSNSIYDNVSPFYRNDIYRPPIVRQQQPFYQTTTTSSESVLNTASTIVNNNVDHNSSNTTTTEISPDVQFLQCQPINALDRTMNSSSSSDVTNTDDILQQQQQQQQTTTIILCLLWMIAALSALDRVAMSVAFVPMSMEFAQQQQQQILDQYNNIVHLGTSSSSTTTDILIPSILFTDTIKGMISSYFSIGYGLAIIPAGMILSLSYISPKQIMLYGILTWSIATICTPYVTDIYLFTSIVPTTILVPLLLIRAMVGMGEAILIPTIHRLLSVWTTSQQKSSALAFIFSGFHFGTISAYLLSPYILDVYDDNWRNLFYLYGTMGILICIPWILYAQDQPVFLSATTTPQQPQQLSSISLSPITGNYQPSQLQLQQPTNWNNMVNNNINKDAIVTSTVLGTDQTTTVTTWWDDVVMEYQNAPWKEFIQSKGVWGMLLAHSAKNWGLYTQLSWTPTYYYEQYNIGISDSAWLSVLPSITGAIGGFIAGYLADNTIKNISSTMNTTVTITQIRKVFQSVGLICPAIALIALGYQQQYDTTMTATVAQWYLMIAVGLQSFHAGGFEAGTQDKAGPKWIGTLYGITALPSVMFGTFGVYITGVVLDVSQQDWSIVWYMNAAINILGALAFILLYDSKREFE